MANELRDGLERLIASLQAVGETKDAEKAEAWLADLDKPEPEPAPAKRGPGRPRKEA